MSLLSTASHASSLPPEALAAQLGVRGARASHSLKPRPVKDPSRRLSAASSVSSSLHPVVAGRNHALPPPTRSPENEGDWPVSPRHGEDGEEAFS